jgi:NDP-sugar pyrophosphorylase family protein
MKAMLLTAGLGTRLRPLTYFAPKPLFPIANKPLIGYLVENLLKGGFSEIIVNLHYLPDAIEEFLSETYDCTFHFSLEHEILGTGGGVKHVRALLEGEDEFILENGDTLQFPDFGALLRARRDAGALSALALRHPPAGDSYTAVWTSAGRITGFGSGVGEPLMYSGVQAVSRAIFNRMPDRDAFSIVDHVYRTAAPGELAAVVDDGAWFDIGTPQRYLAANAGIRGNGIVADPTARISGTVERSVVGPSSVVEGEVRDSVVWDGCSIGPGVRLDHCIVGSGVELRGTIELSRATICCDGVSIPRAEPGLREHGLVIARF